MAKKGINMGEHMPTTENFKHMQWCIANGIKISAWAHSTFEWNVDIVINNKLNRSPQVFKKTEIWEKIHSYYKYYYDKHKI